MKKIGLIFGVALAALTQPVFAQERIIEFFKIARACASDIEKLCSGIMPGGGRIKACMKEHIAKVSPGCLDALMDAVVAGKEAEQVLKPGVIAGLEVHLPAARDYAYCEIAPILNTTGEVAAQFYNTTATTGPAGGCPHDKFIAIDEKKLAAKLGTGIVYLNPQPQTARRHWVQDEVWVFKAGETVDFDGVAATWMASMTPEMMLTGLNSGPYTPVQIHRESKYLYKKGNPIFVMRTPDGKAWVMQSYATEVDKTLSYDQLPQLAAKLKLPDGWKFEVKTLDQDLTIDPRNAGGVAHIIRDELHDVYEGCGFDATCNYVP